MANPYFKFKKFTIRQDRAKMKVCTDSCLFGAYIARDSPSRILDIGTGTGLLALMLAQRYNAIIDAVEMDEASAFQAKENAEASLWASKINVYQERIQSFAYKTNHLYDLIVCNPPFYTNHLPGSSKTNQAIHNTTLPNDELLQIVNKLLSSEGQFHIMLPPYQAEVFESEALEFELFATEEWAVRDKENSKVLRLMLTFQNKKATKKLKCLNIKKSNVDYSDEFAHLLRPYYLYL